MIITGGHEGRLADPAEVVRLLRHGHASVVIDLSHLGAAARAAYGASVASEIEAHRAATGVPQWVVVDEAHVPIGRDVTARRMLNPAAEGYLLVTWQPEELSAEALLALDAMIVLSSARPDSRFVDITAAVADMPRAEIARLLTAGRRCGAAWRQLPRPGGGVHPRAPDHTPSAPRARDGRVGVEPARRFYFKTGPDTATGAVAANLDELEAELGRCDRGVLRHHCPRHEFSRWVAGVFRDERLAATSPPPRPRLPADSHAAVVEQVRLALIAALQARRPS